MVARVPFPQSLSADSNISLGISLAPQPLLGLMASGRGYSALLTTGETSGASTSIGTAKSWVDRFWE
jgi:hypothetical protein